MKTLNFKSKEAYRKWNAYGHLRTKTNLPVKSKSGRKSMFESTPGNSKIKIRGHFHKVKHSK